MDPVPVFARRLAALRRGYVVLALAGLQVALLASLARSLPWEASASAAAGWLATCWGAHLLHAGSLRRRELKIRACGADREISEGISLLLAGDFVGAEALFRDLASLHPRDAEPFFYLGLTLRDQGNSGPARKSLKKALRLDLARRWTAEILKLLAPAHKTA